VDIRETVLRGRRVVLEPLRVEHAEELIPQVADDDGMWTWYTAPPRTLDAMRSWIEARRAPFAEGKALAFAQRDAASGRLFGSTSIFDIDARFRSAEVGHTWIAAPWRGTGVNTEAKLLLFRHCFETLGLVRVQIATHAANARSRKAIEKVGGTFEGVLRSFRIAPDGTPRDTAIYSIVATEWPAVKARLTTMVEAPGPAAS